MLTEQRSLFMVNKLSHSVKVASSMELDGNARTAMAGRVERAERAEADKHKCKPDSR